MLQPRIALRGIRLPFRCLPPTASIPARRFATVIERETPSANSSSSASDPLVPFAPPPTRDDSEVLRTYTPRTPGVRHLRRPVNDHLWKGRPVHRLTFPKRGHAKGGRNNSGRVTVRHHGGGHKRRIRTVDFLRQAPGPHLVERIEYDPGRTAHIALVRSKLTNKVSYILAADGLRAGEVTQSYLSGIPRDLWESMGGQVDPGVMAATTSWRGNCLPLKMVPVGTSVFNVGLRPGKGGQLCRSAGTYATVIAKGSASRELDMDIEQPGVGAKQQPSAKAGKKLETQAKKMPEVKAEVKPEPETVKQPEDEAEQQALSPRERQKLARLAQHVTLRLSSGETRLIHKDCCATVGVASNPNYRYAQLGKAGRSRWLNIRPTVRGVAMNAMDHPHGGGRGKSKGNVDPKSPWGIPTKSGYKTRPKWKINKAVVHARPRNQGMRRRGYN